MLTSAIGPSLRLSAVGARALGRLLRRLCQRRRKRTQDTGNKAARAGPGPPEFWNCVPRAVSCCLRGEAAEGATDVALAEALEGPVAKLAHPLAGDAEHRADLLECVLTAAFEPEVEPQDLRVARRQRAERLLDLIGEEAIHRLFLGIGHLIGDE